MIIVVLSLTMLVTLLVWTNIPSTLARKKKARLLVKTITVSFISIAAVVYFMDIGSEDEAMHNMIHTAPDF